MNFLLWVDVVVLADIELIFFIAALVVLCFGFVTNTLLIADQCWLLLNSACTASSLSLFPTFPHQASKLRLSKKLWWDAAETADVNGPKRSYIPYKLILDDKNWSRDEFFPK